MRLRTRLALALILAAIVPTAIVAHLVGRNLVAGWWRQAVEAQRAETILAAFAAEAYLEGAVKLVATHAERPRLRDGLVKGSQDLFALALRGLDRETTGFETIFVVDARGLSRFHNRDASVVGGDFSHRDYFQGVLRTGRPYVSAPFIGRVIQEPTVGVAAPIRDGSGRLQGLLVGTLTLRALSDMVRRLPHQQGSLMLVGPGGIILAHREAERLMQPAETADPAIARVLSGESGWVRTFSPLPSP